MIQGHTVIMFKDTDSAQFLLVKLEQSVLESKRILFCGCHVLLKESALPRLVTTCWRGWEWFREGSWITEILFIYSESPLFLQAVLSLQLLLSWLCGRFYELCETSVTKGRNSWEGECVEKKWRKWKMPEMLNGVQSGFLEVLLKVLKADFLWLC